MSSSGLIYAFIVGAWAVYLVPMWLRREDELNEARQTRRYTTAIKVLSHKDSFERRYGRVGDGEEAEERLPVAVGQGAAPEAGRDTLERVRAKEREQTRRTGPTRESAGERRNASPSAGGAKPAGSRKPVPAATSPAARRSVVHASVGSAASAAAGPSGAAPSDPSPMMRARRRKVVGVLFALASLGAIVSMDLGLRFVWAMLLPAVALSAYIAWVRKDERARAAERARRRAAAVRAAREARETQRREQEEHMRERVEQEAFEREDHARREAAARRRAAAARARAERRVSGVGPASAPAAPVDPRDLPRAANS